MKKLLFIQNTLNGGGAEKVLVDLLNNIDYNQYNITLLLLYKQGVYLNDIDSRVNREYLFNNVNIYSRIAFKLYALFNIDLLLRFVLMYKKIGRFDVIISFMEGFPVIIHNILRKRANIHISWVHTDLKVNHWTNRMFKKGIEERLYAKMDKIVFVSNDAMLQFDKLFNNENCQKVVIYNPILRESIQKKSKANIDITKAKFTISTVGRLDPQKSYDRLIRVAKIIKDAGYDVEYWILGEGALKDELITLADNLGVSPNICFLGFQRNPYCYIAKSDMFVSTSRAEGFSLVVCEALCLGKPIVSTMTTGPVELLKDSRYGILTDHSDSSIANGLIRLIKDVELRDHYSKMAIQRAAMFDIDSTMNEVYTLFE